MHRFLFAVVLLLPAFFLSCSEDDSGTNTKPGEKGYQVEVRDSDGFKFLLFLPVNESKAVNGKLPTILFLHGVGELGNDLQELKNEGLPKILDGDTNFPFIVISPQCPSSTEWYYTNENNVGKMNSMLDDVIKRYPIDTTRLYITGLSMGGIGTWYFAVNMPGRFAAMAPVAFRGDGWSPCPASEIPAWCFHGALDGTIPLTSAQSIVKQFRDCGGNAEFTIYPDLGHECWTRTYNNQELYTWLLQQEK
jgi:predicted peptidase